MMKPLKTLWRLARRRGVLPKRASRAANERDSRYTLAVDWPKIGLMVFTIAALSVMMSVHLLPDKITLHLGDISPREVRAARSVIYVDSIATERLQQAARLTTRPVYDADESAAGNAGRIVQEFFERIEQERATLHSQEKPAQIAQAAAQLQTEFDSTYSIHQLTRLLTISPALLQKLRATASRLVHEALEREIRDQTDDLPHARQDIYNAAHTILSPEDAEIMRAIAAQALRPNRLVNLRRTEEKREKEARAVPPDARHIVRGERILASGERVTQEHLDKLTALGLLNPKLELTTGAIICTLAAAMVFLVALFIWRALPVLYDDRKRLALLTVIVLLSVFGLKVGATMFGLQFSSGQLGYLGMMSVAAAGMLVSVLLDRNLAVLIVALLSVQSGLLMNHEIRYTVMTLMSSLVGIVSVGSARHKTNLVGTTVALAGANLALVWLLGLLLRDSMEELLTGSAWAVGAAAFATFLYWFGVLALEKPFGILTHTTLLEMSAFDRPLLRHLCAVAPGTYAHSVMVGTLAESGAQAIGADALLCRVGGYYHDIGKSKRPDFFVENQRHGNVHCRLSPSLSALIITAHVRDGIEMGQQHRLPQEIRDIIAQHHGTTLIRYFYHQALADCGGSEEAPPGLEERFRYPGPRPQTREAALVMLADSVEAAARCQERPSLERLQALIAGIFRDKIEDGQLDECDLTLRDLKGITDAFLHVLTAMMHGRIDYPQEPRTATGRPMEVGRPDLRPEPLPVTRAEIELESPYYASAETGISPEAAREAVAHLEARDAPPELLPPDGNGEVVTAVPMMETEVLYDRLPAERHPAPDTNDRTASGSPPPAPRRRTGAR